MGRHSRRSAIGRSERVFAFDADFRDRGWEVIPG
jgi:hypothetical protein